MRQLFVTKELAELAKKYGFNESCLAWEHPKDLNIMHLSKYSGISNDTFETAYTLPTWQQLIDWFRIEYHLIISIRAENSDINEAIYVGYIQNWSDGDLTDNDRIISFDYYNCLTHILIFAFTLK